MGLPSTIHVWEYEKRQELSLVVHDLTKPERDILETLSPYSMLTAEQITRLLYSPASHAYAQRHLRSLVKKGYLEQILPPKQTRFGSTPYVYIMTARSRNYLASIGEAIPPRFRPSEERKRRGGPLLHSLAVNEVLLNAHLLTKTYRDIEFLEFVTERDFTRDPLRVEIPKEDRTVSLSPDLWLHFRQKKVHDCICVEVNLTPVEQKRWRQKVKSYYYALPSYRARFGMDAIVVAVMVASSLDFPLKRAGATQSLDDMRLMQVEERRRDKRLRDLLRWTEMELTALNALEETDLFRMRSINAETLTPTKLFLAPKFRVPNEASLVSLIPAADEEEDKEA